MITRRDRILAAISRHAARTETEAAEEYHSRARNPATRRKPRSPGAAPSEYVEQCKVCDWLDERGAVFFAVPNGAHIAGDVKTRARKVGMLRRAGMRGGAPDLVVVRDGRMIAVEMKSRSGKLSDRQRAMHVLLQGSGVTVIVGYGAADAIGQLEKLWSVLR